MRYTPKEKAFSWSYSKLKNYRTCPRRYYDIDVMKTYQEDFSGEHLKWGKEVHTAFEKRVRDGTPFPEGMKHFEGYAIKLVNFPGKKMVEQQLAIREDLSACEWFAKDTWFRSVADFLGIHKQVALAIDYKTGKVLEDSEQLALMAECIFSHYPEVQAVRTEFWWLADDCATQEIFRRSDRKVTWGRVLPQVNTLHEAHKTLTFPPRPSGLCKRHCIVLGCPHYGGQK